MAGLENRDEWVKLQERHEREYYALRAKQADELADLAERITNTETAKQFRNLAQLRREQLDLLP